MRISDWSSDVCSSDLDVAVHDPLADPDEAQHEYGVMLSPRLDALSGFDAVVAAVPHRTYRDLDDPSLGRLLQAGGLVADIKGMWRHRAMPAGLHYWTL